MPSTKKTPNLRLNMWLGSDKPKKDDFNEDNELLDGEIGTLRQGIARAEAAIETEVGAARAEWDRQLSEMMAEAKAELGEALEEISETSEGYKTYFNSQIQALLQGFNSHTTNLDIHVTKAEKEGWSAGGTVLGSYSGSGIARRSISLGYRPKAGMVFAVGQPIVKAVWDSQSCDVWGAMFATTGAGGGAEVDNDGFVVSNSANADGFMYRLNSVNTDYIYIVWK